MSDPIAENEGNRASKLLQRWVDEIKRGDPKRVAGLYHDGGILLGTFSNKERVGYELILEYFENLLKSPVDVEIVSEHPYDTGISVGNSGHYNFLTNGKTINSRFSFVWTPLNELLSPWRILSHHSSVMPET